MKIISTALLILLPTLSFGYLKSPSISSSNNNLRIGESSWKKNGPLKVGSIKSDLLNFHSIYNHRSSLNVHGGESAGSEGNHFRIEKVKNFVSKNFFLLGMFCAVSLARLAPQLGVDGGIFRPELFIGKYGVFFIFLLSGLSLEVSELKHAIGNTKLNFLIQFTSFIAWPFLVGLPLVQMLGKFIPKITGVGQLLPQPLLDGLLILTCLPTTVNMCIFLTSAANGSVASALCNAALGNLLGIFATPALLLRFFGTSIELPFAAMVAKLVNKVLLPVSVGQALRSTPMKEIYEKNSKIFKRSQEVNRCL